LYKKQTDIYDVLFKCTNFNTLDIKWDNIEPILTSMIAEVNEKLDRHKKSLDEESLNKMRNLDYKKNLATKSIEASPNMIKRPIIPPTDSVKTQPKSAIDDDQIFNDLKPVKFDGLYKKEMTSEDIEQEITKLTQEEVSPIPKKTGLNNRTRINNINDSTYPFKQAFKSDKICNIF
jgi:hypothetical protein